MRNHDRAAQIESELIQLKGWNGIGGRIEEVLGVKSRIAHKFVRRAVQLVGSRFVSDIDNTLATTVRRRGRTGLHLEFVNGIHRWEENQHSGVCINAVDAIDQISDVFHRRAIDHGAIRAAAASIAQQSRSAAHAG